jgi:hypothetical protein
MAQKLTTRWTEPLIVEIPRLKKAFRINPITRGQMGRFFALDAEYGEEPDIGELDALRAKGLAILCEGSDVPLDQLTADEEMDLLWAINGLHFGVKPDDAAAIAQLLKKKAFVAELLQSLPTSTEKPSPSAPN